MLAIAVQAAVPGGPLGSTGFDDVNKFTADTGWLHEAGRLYAVYGVVVFALLLLAAWWSARRGGNPTKMAYVIWTAIGTVIALAINQPIVSAVHEARPFVALPHVMVLISHGADPGFPSDHAVFAGAIAAGVFLTAARIGWVAVVAALLIAFARVYVGVHYPQDVVAGLALGAAVVLLGALLTRRLLTWLVVRAQLTPLAPLLVRAR